MKLLLKWLTDRATHPSLTPAIASKWGRFPRRRLRLAGTGRGPDGSTYHLNRKLSELAFQRRVLKQAVGEELSLLEPVKFLVIFTGNVDEFFRKRVGGLKQQIAAGVTDETLGGRTPSE